MKWWSSRGERIGVSVLLLILSASKELENELSSVSYSGSLLCKVFITFFLADLPHSKLNRQVSQNWKMWKLTNFNFQIKLNSSPEDESLLNELSDGVGDFSSVAKGEQSGVRLSRHSREISGRISNIFFVGLFGFGDFFRETNEAPVFERTLSWWTVSRRPYLLNVMHLNIY